jgi:hypothetical protein
VSCVLLLAGFILGILALAMMKRGDRGAVLTRVGLSVVVYGTLIALAVPGFVRARELSRQRKEAVNGVATAADSVREQAINSIVKGGDQHVDLNQLEHSLNQAVGKTTGDSAALMKAGQAYVQQLQTQQAAYEIAVEKLRSTKVLAISNLTDRSQIPARRAVVQDFLDANDRVKTFVSQSEQHFRVELDNAHVSPTATDSALTSFRKSSGQADPIVLQVRDCDSTMGRAMLDVLDLLDRSWGHWHAKNGGKSVVFDRQADLDAYNLALDHIDTAKTDQATAQQHLATVMSSQQRASR